MRSEPTTLRRTKDHEVNSSLITRGTGEEAADLSDIVANALSDRHLSEGWETRAGAAEALHQRARALGKRAFHPGETAALSDLHATLYALYELTLAAPGSAQALNQYDTQMIALRNELERAWLAEERAIFLDVRIRADEGLSAADAIRRMWKTSAAGIHPLFDFLEHRATREQMVAFFRSDASLNVRFFDLITLSLVGTSGAMRAELAGNLWDEAGRGDPGRSHVRLFESLLESLDVKPDACTAGRGLSLQGMIGHNLFMATCTNRQHFFKSLGVMAITELMDPSQYEKLVRGCRRIGLGASGELDYYEEHVTIDVVHGDGWLNNVVMPSAMAHPDAVEDMLFGAHMRLRTAAAYYDELSARLLRHT